MIHSDSWSLFPIYQSIVQERLDIHHVYICNRWFAEKEMMQRTNGSRGLNLGPLEVESGGKILFMTLKRLIFDDLCNCKFAGYPNDGNLIGDHNHIGLAFVIWMNDSLCCNPCNGNSYEWTSLVAG